MQSPRAGGTDCPVSEGAAWSLELCSELGISLPASSALQSSAFGFLNVPLLIPLQGQNPAPEQPHRESLKHLVKNKQKVFSPSQPSAATQSTPEPLS